MTMEERRSIPAWCELEGPGDLLLGYVWEVRPIVDDDDWEDLDWSGLESSLDQSDCIELVEDPRFVVTPTADPPRVSSPFQAVPMLWYPLGTPPTEWSGYCPRGSHSAIVRIATLNDSGYSMIVRTPGSECIACGCWGDTMPGIQWRQAEYR